MDGDEKLAKWAALFVDAYRQGDAGTGLTGQSGIQYSGVTQAACELLHAVDAGGVPAFVTAALRQIAEDNGIEITVEWTPNQIVESIRSKALDRNSAGQGAPIAPSDQ
jgi:hypothetical protein